MYELANNSFITATDLADYLVKNHNMSFRKAYEKTSEIVNIAEKKRKKLKDLKIEELQKIEPKLKSDILKIFDLKYSNSHMNFFKHLSDSLNYQEVANPFYIKKKYDGSITNISFYHNMVFVRKGINDLKSKEVINNSYEDMKYLEKSSRTGKKFQYFVKYKMFYKAYTILLFVFNAIKKLLLLRI